MGTPTVGTKRPLSQRAEAVYEQLLSGELDQCPPEVEAELLRAGVLIDVPDRSALFPEDALALLLRERLPQYLRDAGDLVAVATQLTAMAQHRTRPGLDPRLQLEFLPDPSQARQAQRMLLSSVERDLLVVDGEWAPGFATDHTSPNNTHKPPDGVRWREVIATSTIQLPEERRTAARSSVTTGSQVRCHPSIPLWAVVVDDRAAMISTGPYPRCGGLLIRVPAMVAMIRGWAEGLWHEAHDLVAGPNPSPSRTGEPLGPAGCQLLDLITAGLTDQAMARVLNLSPRTVRRRIDRLGELLGAANRHQLLLLAREKGWQPRSLPELRSNCSDGTGGTG